MGTSGTISLSDCNSFQLGPVQSLQFSSHNLFNEDSPHYNAAAICSQTQQMTRVVSKSVTVASLLSHSYSHDRGDATHELQPEFRRFHPAVSSVPSCIVRCSSESTLSVEGCVRACVCVCMLVLECVMLRSDRCDSVSESPRRTSALLLSAYTWSYTSHALCLSLPRKHSAHVQHIISEGHNQPAPCAPSPFHLFIVLT